MLLTRLGNKKRISGKLNSYFPTHKMRIELFFGAGGSFFHLPAPKYSILNDLDDDVFNLYQVIQKDRQSLIDQVMILPINESLMKFWLSNQEVDPILKAVRFLLLSNFTYLGKGNTIRLGLGNEKTNLIKKIEPTFLKLKDCKISNRDFRDVINRISFQENVIKRSEAFCYLDPIYLGTSHCYKVPKWTSDDTEDCFKIMDNEGIPAAMSEFDHEQVLDFASDYKMNVIYLGERRNIKSRKNEILITNYKIDQGTFKF